MPLIKTLRFFEAFLMTGFFMVAMFFAVPVFTWQIIGRGILIFFSVYSLILSIYAFNAYCGKEYDAVNKRLLFLQNTSSSNYFIYAVLFFIFSALILLFINIFLLYYLLAIGILWVFYSLPLMGLKNFPFLGSILHFITQVLHFNMVYAVFAEVNQFSVLISIYFALLFSAGHLHHEIIDYEADLKSGIKTSAVLFGVRCVSLISFIVFFITSVYFSLLCAANLIHLFLIIPLIIAFLIQVISFLIIRKKFSDDFSSRLIYQKIYRTAYFLGCASMIVIKFIMK